MESEKRFDSRLFRELLQSLLKEDISVRFRANGRSMYPAIADGEMLQIDPSTALPQRGDVALVETARGFMVHRVIESEKNIRTRGDCCFEGDGDPNQVIGKVSIADGKDSRPAAPQRLGSKIRRWIARYRGHF